MTGNVARLTLVVPVLNETEAIRPFLTAIDRVLKGQAVVWSALFVDDGSEDGTSEEVRRAASEGWPVVLVTLARNFGKEAALTAGLDYADGDAVIPIDVDLQDPPELIPDMLDRWRGGADTVIARRVSRTDEALWKRVSARAFYRLMQQMGETNLPSNVGDFRLLDSRVVEVLRRMPERTRFMKGILSWPGFRTDVVEFRRPAREQGNAKQKPAKLVKLALDGFVSFSAVPLRVWTLVGAATAMMALAYMVWIVGVTVWLGREVPGYASIMSTILFVGGVQLLSIGVLGEYIARIYTEVKGRPIYVVESTYRHPQ